jgi:hypothetical protein
MNDTDANTDQVVNPTQAPDLGDDAGDVDPSQVPDPVALKRAKWLLYKKRYDEKHKEAIMEYRKKYNKYKYSVHREQIIERQREYYKANREICIQRCKDNYRNNRELRIKQTLERIRRKKEQEPKEAKKKEPKEAKTIENESEESAIKRADRRKYYQKRKACLEEMKRRLAEYEAKEKGIPLVDASTTASSDGGSDAEAPLT